MTPRAYGYACVVAALIGIAATVGFWAAGRADLGVLFLVMTVLLAPAWWLYSMAWNRRRR